MRPLLLWCVIGLVFGADYAIWHSVLAFHPGKLMVSVLDIGQGDAILVEGPTGISMLVDGGPDGSVLRKLPEELGWFRNHLALAVETHPDKDHIFGLASVLSQYETAYFLGPGIPDSTDAARALFDTVRASSGTTPLLARRGMRIHLGGGAYADVLYPDRDMSRETDTNSGSVTMHVIYGNTAFMLTGDLPSPVEEYLVSLDSADGNLRTDVLKAGHHGSKYSTGTPWLTALHPSIVAISAGKGNRYGHPNPETLDRIRTEGARITSSIDHGTLRFLSDGMKIREEDEY